MLPWMNQARWFHASCCLQDFVYVLCGLSILSNHNKIERLDCTKIEANEATWELIQLPEVDLKPRSDLAAISISSTEILILGGRNKDTRFSDVLIFNTQSKKCITKHESKLLPTGFTVLHNQCFSPISTTQCDDDC